MNISYDVFVDAFLQKITEYRFLRLSEENRRDIVDGYLRRACTEFAKVCKRDLTRMDNETRKFTLPDDTTPAALDEIVEIVSEGMVVQWLKPYTYKQENLENMLNTTDFSAYSPAELLKQVVAAYKGCKKDFTNKIREYSYCHGDLTVLHL